MQYRVVFVCWFGLSTYQFLYWPVFVFCGSSLGLADFCFVRLPVIYYVHVAWVFYFCRSSLGLADFCFDLLSVIYYIHVAWCFWGFFSCCFWGFLQFKLILAIIFLPFVQARGLQSINLLLKLSISTFYFCVSVSARFILLFKIHQSVLCGSGYTLGFGLPSYHPLFYSLRLSSHFPLWFKFSCVSK